MLEYDEKFFAALEIEQAKASSATKVGYAKLAVKIGTSGDHFKKELILGVKKAIKETKIDHFGVDRDLRDEDINETDKDDDDDDIFKLDG